MSKPSSRPSKIKDQEEPLDLDTMIKEGSKHDFRFILAGRTWTMTAMGRLSKKKLKKIAAMKGREEDANNFDEMDEMLKAGMGDEQFAEFDELDLPMDAVEALFEEWSEHSGIEPGESSASTDS